MGYKDILESVQGSGVTPTASEARQATEQATQRREAEERQREAALIGETWNAAAHVVALLLERQVKPDARIIATSEVSRYLEYKRYEHDALIGPLNKWRMRRIRASRVVAAWDMRVQLTTEGAPVQGSRPVFKYALYLVEDGTIAGMSGMSQKEWERGILIPGFARRHGERFYNMGNYPEVQRGLANLQVLAEGR